MVKKQQKGAIGETAELFKEIRKFAHPIYKKHGLSGLIIAISIVVELIIIVLKNMFSTITFWTLVTGFGFAIIICGVYQLKKKGIIKSS